ncbi:ADP-ribosylglycohydrolase family protein [Fulvivirga sedimenti]|uniref:ADP-ribosylglycohydrolase family protein n=1 Tax=Fulvivirga sedimenti TaxID=2879465 RepID=A0A9X1L007_9BACT|nr:ADP-ribosylglycohydrolase family protein [Fulvivirga sedimenti]MCA6078920.1 ADP-ribosylglycohydrolase family protein [Fulvivirga sedimenti]
MKPRLSYLLSLLLGAIILLSCSENKEESGKLAAADSLLLYKDYNPGPTDLIIDRTVYLDKLQGFWLGACIANWTGLITEMDKIGGDGIDGLGAGFYTRSNWGGKDEPNIWPQSNLDSLSPTIDFYFEGPGDVWGADDDTDIEYMYQYITYYNKVTKLSPEQIRNGWLTHIYSDENSPFVNETGGSENYLWVSNQTAFDLMKQGMLPPATSDPQNNPNFEMIDAQLTTEIFGFLAPGNPAAAVELAHLPIRTTARKDAAWIAEFYVVMYSLAPVIDSTKPLKNQLFSMADRASEQLPPDSYASKMYSYVKELYDAGIPWEAARDSLYERYQVKNADGYTLPAREPVCHGCFGAGINFGASLISLFYGEGDIKETIKIGTLAGWDSDNPTATWGGLLGFIYGKKGLESVFEQNFSNQFNIHRTRGNFKNGIDTFENMAQMGVFIVDRVVQEELDGGVDLEKNCWYIPI